MLQNAISSEKKKQTIKQTKKSHKSLFESLSKKHIKVDETNKNTSTTYERRQVLFLHDREATCR